MRRSTPRFAPVPQDQWTDKQREVMQPLVEARQVFNIFTTLARKPKALKAFLSWASYVLSRSSMPPRERELVILRVGYLCKSGYEWGQHVVIGKRAGLTEDEIVRIKQGPKAPGWSERDAALLQAADELKGDQYIADDTWARLVPHWNEEQLMDMVFVAANYVQVSTILNTFGIQLDPGLMLDPDLRK
jgi:4-carboxymuconolactone decarboxylase